MRELDELLSHYLRHEFERATSEEKAAFRELLALPDPELIGYLLGMATHEDPDAADAIAKIRRRDQA